MKNLIAAAAIMIFCAGAAGAAPVDAKPVDANMNSQNNGTTNTDPMDQKMPTRCSTERAKNSKSCGDGGVRTVKANHKKRRMHRMPVNVNSKSEINKIN